MIQEYAKAICGAVIAGAGAAATAAADGQITLAEGCLIAVAFFTALGSVWAVPNTPMGGKHRRKLEEPVRYDPAANVEWTTDPETLNAALAVAATRTRRPGKYGRNEKRTDPRTLQFGRYLTDMGATGLPVAVDWTKAITVPLGMMLNDQLGCCTVAAKAHLFMAQSASSSGVQLNFTDNMILKAYEAEVGYRPGHPNTDTGASMLDSLNFARKTGIGNHKVGAFAELDPLNHDHVRYAIYVFGAVDIGLDLPQSAEDQFSRGQVWDVVKGSPIAGGHDVCLVGYNQTGPLCITWGAVQQMTWAFLDKYCSEAYACLDPDWLNNGKSPAGFDMTALTADLAAIKGGGDLPPFPSDPPVADGVLAALDAVTLGRLQTNAHNRHQTVEDDAARIITSYFRK